MASPLLPAFSDVARPVIGMVHLRPLPGSPGYGGDFGALIDAAVRDAEALAGGGVHGLMMENFGDTPFFKSSVPPHVISHMAAAACEIRRRFALPLGLNVLRNDAIAALAVAAAAGADFVRVNVLSGASVTDQGLIEGDAAAVLRYRASIGAGAIRILADVRVKHAQALAERPIEHEVDELIDRAGADALIVSGSGTGRPADIDELRQVKGRAGQTPVFIGSGATADNIERFAEHADGFIVGSTFKAGGVVSEPVDPGLVRALIERLG